MMIRHCSSRSAAPTSSSAGSRSCSGPIDAIFDPLHFRLVSSSLMKTVISTIRALMLCAAVLASGSSLGDLVLCYCADDKIHVESGMTDCSTLSNVSGLVGVPAFASAAGNACGPCVDVPVRRSGVEIGPNERLALTRIAFDHALLPSPLLPTAIAAVAETPVRSLRSCPARSTSHASSPLRC